MDTFTVIFWIIVAALFLVWSIWTWRTFRRRKRKLFYFQLVVLLLGLFYITWWLEVFPGSSWYHERKANEEITGKAFTAKEVYVHESPRAFNGDGYSIWVYELDEETATAFLNPEKNFFKIYPIKADSREKWSTKHWDRTPLKTDEEKFLYLALSEFPPEDKAEAKKLQDTFGYIKKALSQQDSYYAYNYYLHSDVIVGNIDFFILCPKDRRLIVINCNT